MYTILHTNIRIMYVCIYVSIVSCAVSPNVLKMVKLDGALFKFVDPAQLHCEHTVGEVPFRVTDTSQIRSLRDVYCPCPQFLNGDITMPQVGPRHYQSYTYTYKHCTHTHIVHIHILCSFSYTRLHVCKHFIHSSSHVTLAACGLSLVTLVHCTVSKSSA